MIPRSILAKALVCGALALTAGLPARADVITYAGYYDLAPCCGNLNPLPNPWLGSPNTIFLGSTSAFLSPSDPDEAAVMIQNTGPVSVTLSSGISIGGLTLWDTLIGSGVVIQPNWSVILSGTAFENMDGSDFFLSALVALTIDGVAHSYTDSGNVLAGSPNGPSNETMPWTEIGRISTSETPLPAALPLFATGLGALGLLGWRRKRKAQAAA
jgi:hypothetical protein